MTDDQIIDAILKREGGYVNHPADRGGPTKFGITIATLQDWRGHPLTDDDVKLLDEAEAREIYRARYIDEPGFDKISDPRLRGLLVDSGVNHGPAKAVKLLQRALGVADDGVLGAQTLLALSKIEPDRMFYRVVGQRARLYGRIISNDPTQATFAFGWMNRLAEFLEA